MKLDIFLPETKFIHEFASKRRKTAFSMEEILDIFQSPPKELTNPGGRHSLFVDYLWKMMRIEPRTAESQIYV